MKMNCTFRLFFTGCLIWLLGFAPSALAADYEISVDSPSAIEGADLTFTVSLDQSVQAGDEVEIDYTTTVTGTATSGVDFTAVSGTVVLVADSQSADFEVPTSEDTDVEGDETVIVSLSATCATTDTCNLTWAGGDNTGTGTIIDNSYEVSIADAGDVREEGGAAEFTVTLNPGPRANDTITVNFSTADGDATIADSDYANTTDAVQFRGEGLSDPTGPTQTVSITVNDDPYVEPDEPFYVNLTGTDAPARVALIDAQGQATILNDDYEVDEFLDITANEADGDATLSVVLDREVAPGESVSFDVSAVGGTATEDDDYTAPSTPLVINAGNDRGTITVPIDNDDVVEGDQTIIIRLTPASDNVHISESTSPDYDATVTIVDDDYEVSISDATPILEDGGPAEFFVTLNPAPRGADVITVAYATENGTAEAGSDYTASSGTLEFRGPADAAPTGGSLTIPVTILDNNIFEDDKTFGVRLSNPAPSSRVTVGDDFGQATILDDDYRVTFFADIDVSEDVGTAELEIVLNRNVLSGDSVVFNVAVLEGSSSATLGGPDADFTAPVTPVSIPADSDRVTISVPIVNDDVVEPEENIAIQIEDGSGAPGNVIITGATDPDNVAEIVIAIDDKYQVEIDDITVTEGDTATFTVNVSPPIQDEHDGLIISYQTGDGTASSPADYGEAAGDLSFPIGETDLPVDVLTVLDDIDEGASETYYVNLSTTAAYADIVNFVKAQGIGTIEDDDYTITPDWTLGGTVTLQSPPGTDVPIEKGVPVVIVNASEAIFTAVPDYDLTRVLVDGDPDPGSLAYIDVSGDSYRFNASTPIQNHTIEVEFDHQILYTADGPGRVIDPDSNFEHNSGPGSYYADHDSNQEFTITADADQCVTDVIFDGTSQGAFTGTTNRTSFFVLPDGSGIERDHELIATFGDATITVQIGADDGETGSAEDSFIQNPGTGSGWRAYVNSLDASNLIAEGTHDQSFSIPADIPLAERCDARNIIIRFQEVDGWLRPSDIYLDLNYSFEDQTVIGLYDADSHILTLEFENGSINLDPSGAPSVGENRYIYTSDSVVSLTPVPDVGWYFHRWQVDASGTDTPLSVTMSSDKTVRAVFVQGCQDADGDGYRVDPGDGSCDPGTLVDCDDTNPLIYPGAPEICGDGIDQSCSGGDLPCTGDDFDEDGDGYTPNQGDCNDSDPWIHPGAIDIPGDGIDQDCFGGDKTIGSEVTCVTPSNIPANASRKPAPPLLMFLLDDSGSMDWEFMTDEYNQLFSRRYYVYPSHYYSRNYGTYWLTDTQRRLWKSQWAGYNKIFFDPEVTYDPWPLWDEVAASVTYSGAERGAVRSTERRYDTDNDTFPDRAFTDDFVHADMDDPRNNTVDPGMGHSWSYLDTSGVAGRQTFDLNDEFFRVKAGADAQQVTVARTSSSSGSSTAADAIGLSIREDLEQTTPRAWTWYDTDPYDGDPGNDAPRIIYDRSAYSGRVTYSGSDIYSESDYWYNSGGYSYYEWGENLRYTTNVDQSVTWRLNMTSAEAEYCNTAGGCYVYTWVDEFSDRDNNASYSVYSYDSDDELIATQSWVDQSPGSSDQGRRWVRIGDTRHLFKEQTGSSEVIIRNAHYFVWSDTNGNGEQDFGEIYLINIPGSGYNVGDYSLEYYQFNDLDGNDRVDDGELVRLTDLADYAAVQPVRFDETGNPITDEDELAYVVRQNFADWYSFYRRRMLTAKAAVGLTVADMERVELGLHTINRSVSRPLEMMETAFSEEKINYLKEIYDIDAIGSTPLRRGMNEVGRYLEEGTSGDYSGLSTGSGSVFADAEDGGECQRAYAIVMTDGYYNGYFSTDNEDENSDYALRDSSRHRLADIAHLYYHTDLDSGLDDMVPEKGYDDAAHQHMVTFGVSFGVFGDYDPTLFPDCLPSCTSPGSSGCPDLQDLGKVSNCVTNTDGELECYTCTMSVSGDVSCSDERTAGPFRDMCPDWPSAYDIRDTPAAVDDLYHASVNGRGKFLNAANPADLVSSLKAIKDLIEENIGTASSVSINANKIETNTLLYQTSYDSGDWSGDVHAICLDTAGNPASCDRVACRGICDTAFQGCVTACDLGDSACEDACRVDWYSCYETNNCASYETCSQAHTSCVQGCAGNVTCLNTCDTALATCLEDPPEVKWVASEKVAATDWNSRQIITTDSLGNGLPFRWDAGITAAMKTMLDGDSLVLDYLRGDQSCEVGNTTGCTSDFRVRTKLLGDFINAEPYYYRNSGLGVEWVIAGANDGMLHVFDSDTGDEVFAFIPDTVFENLVDLTVPAYNDSHTFFVDGYTVARDLGGTNLLVGGFGQGGKGFYALDLDQVVEGADLATVEDYAASIVKWEINTATPNSIAKADLPTTLSDHLGYSFSRPQIVKSNDPSAEWLLVFGNGYDSALGRAVLFLVGLDSYGEIVWTHIIDTGEGDMSGNCNGLSSPAIIYPQGDGVNDFLYAGDLLGNMWKFDISADDRNNWGVYFQDVSAANPNKPLFSAKSNAGYRQPITMQPDVSISCVRDALGYFVTFGTGRLFDPDNDNFDDSIQSMYGIWDWAAEWQMQGVDPRSTYLGDFEPENTAVSGSCTSSCNTIEAECESECLGNTECELSCIEESLSCISNCQSIRTLSNMENILGDETSADYVALLQQYQASVNGIVYNSDGSVASQQYGETNLNVVDQVVRTVSDNEINWLKPADRADFVAEPVKIAHHVGWYFDLPENGERAVKDVLIAGGRLIFTTSTPSSSPCAGGGVSYIWAVDACTGARTAGAFFDLNNDGIINSDDYINVGTEADPIWVAPTSVAVGGIAPAPTLVEVQQGLDRLYFPDGSGPNDGDGPPPIQGMGTIGYGMPILHWRELDWQ